jgi:N-acetyl-anhydromuramyl-L-alanine amidase AmpD
MKIIEQKYTWNGKLTKRAETKNIILHHRAGNGDAQSIHKLHLNQGYTGFGYHFYVRKDGSVYRGRPIDTVGAHCIGKNSISVGICFEGNFENEQMQTAQIKAGQELVSYLTGLYPKAEVKRHKDLYATACPGKNFPFDKIKRGAVQMAKFTTANDIIWELMNGKYKVEITEVDNAVKALEKAKNEDSSLYWILYKIVNS